MSELKEKLQKAINEIDFDNMCEYQKSTLEKALVMLQVKWFNNNAKNLEKADRKPMSKIVKTYNTYWNWNDSDYRIIPEKKLVPFDISDAGFLIGKTIKSKIKNKYDMIIGVVDKGIIIADYYKYYEELLSDFTFTDGTPCGKEV